MQRSSLKARLRKEIRLSIPARNARSFLDPAALHHVEHGESAPLGEADIAYPERFCLDEIVFCSEAAVEARLARSNSVERALSLDGARRARLPFLSPVLIRRGAHAASSGE